MKVEVYTDGSATTNDRPGGWAYVLVFDGEKYAECAGHMDGASNNDAEMEAAIQGLAAVLKCTTENTGYSFPENVTLVSDSQLILGWANGSYRFKQTNKINKFKQLQFLVKRLNVQTRWVQGHSGDEHNERCDRLANEARLSINKKVDQEVKVGQTLIGTKKSGTVCVWYKGCLKIVDLESNLVENYKRELHGSRGSMLEIREEKSR